MIAPKRYRLSAMAKIMLLTSPLFSRFNQVGKLFRLRLTTILSLLLFPTVVAQNTQAQAQPTILPVTGQSGHREFFSNTSPAWLLAVGKLQVPGIKFEQGIRRNHWENCSATLVTQSVGNRANTIVTAWHCLEFYTDLSKTITFTLPEHGFSTEAYRLADGGGMDADWAVLRLQHKVPASVASALAIHPKKADVQRPISMAGY